MVASEPSNVGEIDRARRVRVFVASPGDDRPRPAVLVIHGWNSAASLMLPIASLVHAAGAHAFFMSDT